MEFPYGCDSLSPISNISDLVLYLTQKPRASSGFLRLIIIDNKNLILHPTIHGSKYIKEIYDLLQEKYHICNFTLTYQERPLQ